MFAAVFKSVLKAHRRMTASSLTNVLTFEGEKEKLQILSEAETIFYFSDCLKM